MTSSVLKRGEGQVLTGVCLLGINIIDMILSQEGISILLGKQLKRDRESVT